ncbi:MAG: glycine--tRNA ligase subunit beta [Pseudomonadota bacterium]
MADLLLELFSEEIPARMQARACEDLKKLVTQGMVDRGLIYEAAAAFATPRRLTLSVTGLPKETMAVREERKGPRTDAPDKALEGFLRSTGLTKDQLEARDDKKGQVWFAIIDKPGRTAADVIAEVVPEVIRAFPWPRSMRWGAGDLRWVRPLQSIMCILSDEAGAEVVPFTVDQLTSGAETRGHRFMGPEAFAPTDFDDYVARLNAAKVVLDPAERSARIWADATNMAFAQGMEVVEDKGLLAEVAGLVEWPVVLMGEIEEQFLGLPPEVLQTSMKEHQKFFSVRNPKTGRIEKFVTVANIETADQGATILAGNQRVLAARLSDALFFWENDLRTIDEKGMAGMAEPLTKVTFHNRLGSMADRVARVASLAKTIAPFVSADPEESLFAAAAAKADLASEMVYEFPELQGTMARYYALKSGKYSAAQAAACESHYSPLGPSDDVPTEPIAIAVALADKLDMLTSFWLIDEKPTGSKDPFALRRAALGVVRIILDNRLRLSLESAVEVSCAANLADLIERKQAAEMLVVDVEEAQEQLEAFKRAKDANLNTAKMIRALLSIGNHGTSRVGTDLLAFFADRLKVHLRGEGVHHDVIDASFQLGGQDDLVLLVNRVNALQTFIETEDGKNLLAGYKRAVNILAAEQKKDGVEYTLDPDVKFASLPEETALFVALDHAEADIAPALEAEDFAAAMTAMAALRAPIDAFFEKVTVNDENDIVRRNRLCLLNRVKVVMERVAVFSAIEG